MLRKTPNIPTACNDSTETRRAQSSSATQGESSIQVAHPFLQRKQAVSHGYKLSKPASYIQINVNVHFWCI